MEVFGLPVIMHYLSSYCVGTVTKGSLGRMKIFCDGLHTLPGYQQTQHKTPHLKNVMFTVGNMKNYFVQLKLA